MDFIKDIFSGISKFFLENRIDIAIAAVAAIIAAIFIFFLGRIKGIFSSIKNWFASHSKTEEWRRKYISEKLGLPFRGNNSNEAKRLYVPTRFQEEPPILDEVTKHGPENPERKELIPYFLDKIFVEDEDNPNWIYCVLAETGMGKTTFLVQLLNAYINKYTKKTLPYDIYILPMADDKVLEKICNLPVSSKRNTILLLDALDENTNAYDRKDAAGNIISTYEKFREELEQAVEEFRFVVITCRTQFFPDNKSELKELKHGLYTYSTPEKSLPRYKRLFISPFSDKDINKYIGEKYKWHCRVKRKAKKIISSIKSLAVRPLILSYIDDLIGGKIENGILDAYRIIIDKWLLREVNTIRDEDERARQKELLYYFSRKLAVYIYGHWRKTGNLYLTQAEYETFKTENPEFNGVDFSFATKSLVTRDSQHNILFAHKSFLEYFCAEQVFMGKFSDFYFPGMDMARTFFDLFCQADEKELLPDEDEIDKARRYNKIGRVFNNQIGDYDKALEYYFKALEIREKVLDKEHPDIATSYNNIGSVYDDKGDYDKALEYYFKALEIREKVLGKEHPDIATLYNNIGFVYGTKGDYDKALEYHLKALAIKEKVLGEEHPSTATLYNNIGYVYYSKGDYDKALEYHLKALEIREKVLGKEHPDTATSYNNIGNVYSDKGKYDKALEYYFKDLAISEKVLGKEHPDTAFSYNNIGNVYYSKGDYDNALEYLFKALEIREKKLGPKHPFTRTTYRNIGNVYMKMGNKEEAQKWYDKANK